MEEDKLVTGDSFGDEAKDFVRMSLTVPDEILVEACDRISSFVKSL